MHINEYDLIKQVLNRKDTSAPKRLEKTIFYCVFDNKVEILNILKELLFGSVEQSGQIMKLLNSNILFLQNKI